MKQQREVGGENPPSDTCNYRSLPYLSILQPYLSILHTH